VLDGSGHLHKESLAKQNLLTPYKLCLPSSPDYAICYNTKDCLTCAAIAKCGWCEATNKCTGGNN
jgi:hypothetical protein